MQIRSKEYFICIFLLSACSTSYDSALNNNGFGYSERKLNLDIYAIQVKGNAYTNQLTVKNYFMRRAEELCNGTSVNIIRMNEAYINDTYRGVLGKNEYQNPFISGEIRCQAL